MYGCDECTKDTCTLCGTNREVDSITPTTCSCNSNWVDHKDEAHEFSKWCTSCIDVVLSSVHFSGDMSSIIIEFPVQISIIGHESTGNMASNQICIDVIDTTAIGKLGTSPMCKLDDTELKIIISL